MPTSPDNQEPINSSPGTGTIDRLLNTPISRRRLLQRIGLGIVAVSTGGHSLDRSRDALAATALDGDQPTPEAIQPLVTDAFSEVSVETQKRFMISNREAFERDGVKDIDTLLEISPRFSFADRAVTNLGMVNHPEYGKTVVNIASIDDPSEQYPSFGIITPLITLEADGVKTSSFVMTGIPLGVTRVPFRSDEPGFHEQYGDLDAFIGQMGISSGTGDEAVRAVVPLFLFLTGKDSSVKYHLKFADRTGDGPIVLDGKEAKRREYDEDILSEDVVTILNDNIGNSAIAIRVGTTHINDGLKATYKKLGYPPDVTTDDDFIEAQSTSLEDYYKEVFPKLTFAQANKDPNYTPWVSFTDAPPEQFPFSDISEAIEDVETVKARIPTVDDILTKEFVTSDDLTRLLQPLLIDFVINTSQ